MSECFLRAGAQARAGALLFLLCAACDDDRELDADATEQLAELELAPEAISVSATNAFADRDDAAALGRQLFFDRRLSSEGTVACADCHDPKLGFSDARRVSEGVREQDGARHSMPLTTAALQSFLLWDGRADSAWRQPLYALENEREMDFTRSDVALFIATELPAEYEAVFGPLPDLGGVPLRTKPGDDAWDALPAETRDGVQRVFVNVGKAIEAYERRLVCTDTRFDQWVRNEIALSDEEEEGAAQFVRSGCIQCHNGPAVSDGLFHNLGLSRDEDEPDIGREEGLALLLADELNGASSYSDDPEAGAEKIAEAAAETRTRGAFRTASLRGVTQRPRFGHRGVHTDLEEFIRDTYNRRGRGGRNGDGDGNDDDNDIVGELDPILDDVNAGGDDARVIVQFLRTMECRELPPELLEP